MKLAPVVREAFSKGDFHQLGMRSIAKEAKVGYATLYRHFGTKEQLLFSFIDEWLIELIESMIEHLQGLESIKEKFRKMLWIQLAFYERNIELGKILFMTVPRKTWMEDKSFRQEQLTKILLDVIKEGQRTRCLCTDIPPRYFLDIMHGTITRAFQMWIYRGKRDSLSSQTNMWFKLIWSGFSRPVELPAS
jgi:AcrR family transcriptional regulator